MPALAGLPQIPQQPGGATMMDPSLMGHPGVAGEVHHNMAQITPMHQNQIMPRPSKDDRFSLPTSTSKTAPVDTVHSTTGAGHFDDNHGLKARWGDAHHPATEKLDHTHEVDEKEFSFFNDLTRQFVKSAIIGGECHLVSLKTGQNKLAIYQVDKNLENFFLIDQESGKSDLWALSGIEVRPAPNKWALSLRSQDELSKMVLVKYTHPSLHPVTPLVVVSLKTKSERDLFYAGMKILRLYAGHADVKNGDAKQGTLQMGTSYAVAPETNVLGSMDPPPDHAIGGR
jgi:hypothetical protein